VSEKDGGRLDLEGRSTDAGDAEESSVEVGLLVVADV